MALAVDCVARGSDILGECPLWDERERKLWWVDSRAPALKRLDPASGEVTQRVLGEVVGTTFILCDIDVLSLLINPNDVV